MLINAYKREEKKTHQMFPLRFFFVDATNAKLKPFFFRQHTKVKVLGMGKIEICHLGSIDCNFEIDEIMHVRWNQYVCYKINEQAYTRAIQLLEKFNTN